jgi:uncharacterized Zn finger protein
MSPEQDMTECKECGSDRLHYKSPEYDVGMLTEKIHCEECGAVYEQRWTLEERELVQSGS